ncbi:hypothetical protein PanWU01x14_057190 [Parasponia andersonii]|uniref:Uncharacterized protein n=1 Tax=Parasponia andersonii TaxID=3476 RepID=A0A2P5DJR7_PARAD|nr:hypothetical protein PanWU01x14_057190 [Parasponia andersonii]
MADHGDHDEIEVATSSNNTSLSIRDILQDLGLSKGEEPEVMITQEKHRVLIDLESPETKTGQDAPEGGEDRPEALGCEADDAFLTDLDNEFGADDVDNIVTLRTLNRNR